MRVYQILSTARARVIDAEKNILTRPLHLVCIKRFPCLFFFFFSPKVKIHDESGAEKQQRGQAVGWWWGRGELGATRPKDRLRWRAASHSLGLLCCT